MWTEPPVDEFELFSGTEEGLFQQYSCQASPWQCSVCIGHRDKLLEWDPYLPIESLCFLRSVFNIKHNLDLNTTVTTSPPVSNSEENKY